MKEEEKKLEKKIVKKRKKSLFRRLLAFLIYELIIVAITAPLFVFYGPFENVKEHW